VTALRSGLSFGAAMTLVFALRHGWGAALVAGPCAGLATTEPEAFMAWSDARKRILGSP
jgi:hypothetical protein